MGRRLRTQTRFDLALGDVCGEAALREAIVDYLRVSRGIDCQPEQVFITHGYAASMALILHALAQPGDGMWMEDRLSADSPDCHSPRCGNFTCAG